MYSSVWTQGLGKPLHVTYIKIAALPLLLNQLVTEVSP